MQKEKRRGRRKSRNDNNDNKDDPRALLSRGEGALGAVVRILTQPSLSVTTHGRRAYRFSLNASSAMTSTASHLAFYHSQGPRVRRRIRRRRIELRDSSHSRQNTQAPSWPLTTRHHLPTTAATMLMTIITSSRMSRATTEDAHLQEIETELAGYPDPSYASRARYWCSLYCHLEQSVTRPETSQSV